MIELRSIALAHVLHVLICTGFIVWDRRRLARRDPYGAARMWRPATLWLVGCGFFLPPITGVYAHVVITRRGAWWRRHGLASLITLGAVILLEGSFLGLASALGWGAPGDP